METIDYPTRQDLVEALLDFRKRGVHAEVVHNGRTLAFPDGIGLTLEEGLLPPVEHDGTEHDAPADGVEKVPAEGDTLLGVTTPEKETPMDRSTFTVEGTCSECHQEAIAEPDGTWIHVEAANHGDNEGEFVPNAPVEEPAAVEPKVEDEDLIGAPVPAKATKRSRKNS